MNQQRHWSAVMKQTDAVLVFKFMISVLWQHLSARNSNALTSALCLQCFDAVGWVAGRASSL